MKKTYKNKRDLYKSQAEIYLKRAELAEQRLIELQKQDTKKVERYDATVYCQKCYAVEDVSIPRGVSIIGSQCIRCKANACLPVSSYPKCQRAHF